MANNINNRFIHCSTYESFKKYKDNISGESIVFIKDLQLIYTHGTFYGEQSDLSDLEGISVITISGDDIISGSISKSDTTANITLSHSESGVTEGSYGNNTSTTPSVGSSITIPKVTVDSKGHISSASNQTIQLPGTTLDDLGITATSDEINYVDGVTGNIQNQLNSKQPTITGAASTITTDNLTSSKALISNSSGKVTTSSVTSTELGYLSGVTGGIQSQLNTLDSSLDNILSNGRMHITDKINLTAISSSEILSIISSLSVGQMKFYLVSDSSGNLPSTTESYVTVPSSISSYFGKTESFGVSVGDICVIVRLSSLLSVARIISLNDAKPASDTFPGADGLESVWDKTQINKIPSLESTLNSVKAINDKQNEGHYKIYYTSDNYNIDQCLSEGIYLYGRTGRSMTGNSSDEYYIVDVDVVYNTNNSLYYCTQRVYSVNYPGRAFTRIISTTGLTNYNGTYGDWVQIGILDQDSKVTSSENHYTPTEATDITKNTATTPTSNSAIVISNLNSDSKGHITSVDTINVATIKYVDDKVKSLFKYKGTVGTGGTVTSLPATHSTGDAYLVKVAGSYAGQNCEAGDLIICIVSGTTANNSDWSVINTNWSVEVPGDNSLVWESEKTIATIGGIPVKVTLPSGSVESTFTGKEVTSDTPSKTTSINSITSAGSVPTREKTTPASGTHTHSFTPAGTVSSTFKGTQGTTSTDTTNTATVYSITGVGSVPTISEVKPSSGTHTHSLTAEGTVSSSFTGTPGNTGKADTTNTVTINSLSGVGELPSRTSVSVPKSDHTHSFIPEGTITSTFTGSSVTVPESESTTSINSIDSVGTLPSVTMPTTSVSYSSGKLTITHTAGSYTAGTLPTYTTKTVSASNHTHSVTAEGSVISTFAGDSTNTDSTTDTTSVYSITDLGSVPSYTEITVPSSDHIHSYTPAGSVESSFTGESVTSGAPSATVSVNSVTNVGSVPTRSAAITVSTSNHTHSLTPSGTIESSFTGTSDLNSGTPSTTIDVYSITGVGSVPTYQSVSVASSDHTHNVTTDGTINSEFLGTTGNLS